MKKALLFIAIGALAQEPLEMSSDIGYRSLWGQRGSFNTYRSVVNLGEGPRLLQFQGKMGKALRIEGANWGDPLNTFQLNSEKTAIYRLNFQYRNIAYFNALPSFASPQLARLGTEAYTTNQNSMDTRQRFWSMDLDLLPGKRFQPFFGIAQNSGIGFGVSPIVLDENSYAGASRIDNSYTVFRGGVRWEKDWLHLNLEQGGATYSDSSSLANTDRNTGNRENPLLGRQLFLDRYERLYALTGEQIYSSAQISVSPLSWFDFNAEYYFSQPKTQVQFNESAAGTIFLLDALRFVNGQQSFATGFASQPRTNAGFGMEVRPFSRLRVVQSWRTERMHNAGFVSPFLQNDRLIWRDNEQRLEAFYDLNKWLTVFGGHRYLWGDARIQGVDASSGALRRHSGLGGAVIRPFSKLTVNAETEVGRGTQNYFRTSLQNFEQVKVRARYQISERWHLASRFARLDNANDTLAFRSQQANVSLQWTTKRATVISDYTRSGIFSDINFLDPVLYRFERSLYRDNAHSGTLAIDLQLPRKTSLTAGGSFFRSTGSRPTRFYQPLMRLLVPVTGRAALLAEWRHYSMGQPLYTFESFGVQQFTVGLRLGNPNGLPR